MGLIKFLFGLGPEVRETAEVFVSNKTKAAAQEHTEFVESLRQLGAEYAQARAGWFDALVNGLNRLPRPALALGTLALFGFAMADPVAFGVRMQGLALVPEPLWWLLGAVVSFYFGARELHHFRGGRAAVSPEAVRQVLENMEALRGEDAPVSAAMTAAEAPEGAPIARVAQDGRGNAALAEWQALKG